MTSTDLVTAAATSRGVATRTPTGLLLSIGDKTTSRGGREIPTRIDYFRPKEGQLEQYAQAAAKFADVYGDKPKQINDVYFLSNNIGDVLDIRLMAWGSSGVRLVGDTNYATLPLNEWEQRAFSFTDTVTFYPLNAKEVAPAQRADWNGEPIRGELNGPDDPRIERLEINLECTLKMCLPQVMGFGTVAQITTKSRRSMRNLYSSVWDQWTFFQQQLIGVPFRLTVRPAKTRRFDGEKKQYVPVEFFELVLDTPFTVQEAIDAIKERKEALGGGQPGLGSPEARQLTAALALPAAPEDVQLREEPHAPVDTVDDATLNRIAQLEQAVGAPAARVTLRGVFGVDSAAELAVADASRYEEILQQSLGEDHEFVDPDEVEFGEQS